MSDPITLINPTDDELSAAVAEHVLKSTIKPHKPTQAEIESGSYFSWEPNYATSADAVLPLLEKRSPWAADSCKFVPNDSRIKVWLRETVHEGVGPTFAKAACIALLRAAGHTVEMKP